MSISDLPAQFVLSPHGSGFMWEGWEQVAHAARFSIHHHHNLAVHQASHAGGFVSLLGYALDPDNPDITDAEIAADVAGRASDRSEVLRRLAGLSGRYVVIVDYGGESYAVGDCFGARQLFFVNAESGVWCASQPRLLEDLLGLKKDAGGADFEESAEFAAMAGSPGRCWPPYRTPVAGVRHLAPNHVLDLSTGLDERFWPARPLQWTADDDCQAELARVLRGSAIAAARRAPLTLLLTGGHDSRLVLAALQPVADSLETVSIRTSSGRTHDWEVPAQLAEVGGFRHTVVDASSGEPSKGFWEAYTDACPVPEANYAANAEALSSLVGDRLVLTGHGAEVAKKVWRQARFARRPTPARITLDLGLGNHPYARAACAEWLDRLDGVSGFRGDVLYWEQRLGRWAANWMLGYDLVWSDALLPFGNRRLLEILIRRRDAPASFHDPLIWDDLIRMWWPELMTIPYGYVPVGKGGMVKKIKRSVDYLRVR